ncbi:hypothetical protein WR25_11287 [Diploscapter pachys]|uniref:INTS8 TPR repeats domain-containing protein n=1 Tax=Diploscapter pachys TaxID=2018661 RepID=A0A2A2KB24_9BILA|nr:hypothetical protein WR25_11287 [Diploscapter pachys]
MLCDNSFEEQLLHEYEGDWSEPKTNWFDYFVDRKRLQELLENGQSDNATLSELCIQFVSEALATEKEISLLDSQNDQQEDVQYINGKCACLWLCAAACFSALKWDFSQLIDRGEWSIAKSLVERLEAFLQGPSVPPPIAAFEPWITHSFTMFVYQKTTLPFPAPKIPSFSQASANETSISKQEAIKKLIGEIKERVPSALAYFTKIANSPCEMAVPAINSFLSPFVKAAPDTLEVAITGPSLVVEIPQVDFTISGIPVPAKDLANKANFEMVEYKFSNGDLSGCKHDLLRMNCKMTNSDNRLIAFQPEKVNGYCTCLGLKPIFPKLAKRNEEDEMIIDQKFLTDDLNIFRKRRFYRRQAETQLDGHFKIMVAAENMARDAVEGRIIAIRPNFDDPSTTQRFVQSLIRQVPLISDRNFVTALLHFLSANYANILEELKKYASEMLVFGGVPKPIVHIQRPPSIVVPGAQLLRVLLSSDNSYWRILIHFKLETLKAAFMEMQQEPVVTRYFHSKMLRYSDVLDEVVIGPTRSGHPINVFHLLLLSKLNQLGSLGNIAQWKVYVDRYVNEMGASQNQTIAQLFALEFIRLQNNVVNSALYMPGQMISSDLPLKCPTTKSLLLVDLRSLNNIASFFIQSMATLLNIQEYEFIIKKVSSAVPQSFPLLTLVQLMAAVGQHPSNSNVVSAFVENFTHLFVRTSGKRRGDNVPQFADRDQIHKIGCLVQLLKFIREPFLLSCLLNFFTHLFNRALITEKKDKLRIYNQPKATEMFGQETPLPSAPNSEAILECLDLLLKTAIRINPVNAELLRTMGDLKYVQDELDEATCYYLETLVVSKPDCFSVTVPFNQPFINEEFWTRLRVCFTNLRLTSFAALICQFLENDVKLQHLLKVAQTLSSSTFDSPIESFPIIWDQDVAEMLASFYEANNQQQAVDSLIDWTCKTSMNSSSPEIQAYEKRRRMTRAIQVLAAHTFAVHL